MRLRLGEVVLSLRAFAGDESRLVPRMAAREESMPVRFIERIGLALLLVLAVPPLFAQRTTQVTGRITDPSDAVVPGADVTVTNEDTAVRRETKTNELGYYVVPLLQPGRYLVTVQKEGFRPISRSGVVLAVDQ